MKVYIVRHGEVLHNALKQYNNENEDLNENGIRQANELKEKVKNINYDIIISSPLLRAKHTAQIINVNNKKILINDKLKERNPGDLSGKPITVTNRDEYWNYNERFNIEAITVAPYHHDNNISIPEGNEKSYNEIIKICKYLDFDTTNKVYKGSEDYLQNDYTEITKAVEKIIEIAMKNEKTYILAIGAITNIAIAILKEPKIIDRIEIVWLGGHSLLQNKNDEFNFRQDIKAVQTVFESNVKLTIIPCNNVASNLRTSIYELEHFLKGKNELCDYLCQRFYNDGVHGIQERRVIWDISVIAYMLNKTWFTSEEISCPRIREDSSYEVTNNNRKIMMINYIEVDKVYTDLFNKLTK